MMAKIVFITLLMLAAVATIFTGGFIIWLFHKTDAVLFIRDYVGAYYLPAMIYLFLALFGAFWICDKYNLK